MKTKNLVKPDAKNCIAKLSVNRVFIDNDSKDYWIGIVAYYESSMRLFTQKSKTIRLTEDDALQDAETLAKENGF